MPTTSVVTHPATDPAIFLVKRSPSFGAIAAALAKAQGEIVGAEKDRENPHFKSKYATLAAVWDACRLPLSKAGIAVFQPVTTEGVKVTVTTLLAHASGEWIAESLTLKALQDSPQGIGSAMTYGRRYALAAMVGVAPEDEDDDGNGAAGNGHVVQPAAQAARRESPKPAQRQSQQPSTPAAPPAPAAAAPTTLDGSTGKVADVLELPSGNAWSITLMNGFKCGTRDKEVAERTTRYKVDGVEVEIATRPAKKPGFAPMLEWIDVVKPEPVLEPPTREPGSDDE